MNNETIKKEVSFLNNVLYSLTEKQKLTLPPTIENVTDCYSTGVLACLLSIKHLMTTKPINGVSQLALDIDTLNEFINKLGIEAEFKQLDNE